MYKVINKTKKNMINLVVMCKNKKLLFAVLVKRLIVVSIFVLISVMVKKICAVCVLCLLDLSIDKLEISLSFLGQKDINFLAGFFLLVVYCYIY